MFFLWHALLVTHCCARSWEVFNVISCFFSLRLLSPRPAIALRGHFMRFCFSISRSNGVSLRIRFFPFLWYFICASLSSLLSAVKAHLLFSYDTWGANPTLSVGAQIAGNALISVHPWAVSHRKHPLFILLSIELRGSPGPYDSGNWQFTGFHRATPSHLHFHNSSTNDLPAFSVA